MTTTATAAPSITKAVTFLGHRIRFDYDLGSDTEGRGFHLDTSLSFYGQLSPSDAEKLLKGHNYNYNRRLDDRFTDMHMRDYGNIALALIRDASAPSGFSIHMPDGQHTCDIIRKSKKALPCGVMVFQVDNEVGLDRLFATFDSGRRRYFEQALTHALKTGALPAEKYPGHNILRLVPGALEWVRGGYFLRRGMATPINVKLETLRSDPETIGFCEAIGKALGENKSDASARLITRGALAALFQIFLHADEESRHRFFQQYFLGASDGEAVSPSSPVALVRNKMSTRPLRKTNEVDHLSWVNSAWEHFKSGSEVSRINSRNLTPEQMKNLNW